MHRPKPNALICLANRDRQGWRSIAGDSPSKKHGLDLADAAKVIESGQTVTFEDRRFDYGEERFVTLGPLDGALVVVVTAETENHIRVISMRKANRHEQGIYRENLG